MIQETGQATFLPAFAVRSCATVARFSIALAGALGLMVLMGWSFDVEAMKRILPGATAMNPMTAVAMVAAALGLGLQGHAPQGGFRRPLALVLGLIVATIGAARLIDYAGGALGIDRVLFADSLESDLTGQPNRIALNTATALVLVGAAIGFLDRRIAKGWRPAEILSLLAFTIALVAVLGYLFDIRSFYRVAAFVPMAFPTALGLMALSIGLICARTDDGFMRELTSPRIGGHLARRALPSALLITLVLAWLRLEGARAGWYDQSFGVSLSTAAIIAVLTALIWSQATLLNRADDRRHAAEINLQNAHHALELAIEKRTAELADANRTLESEVPARKQSEASLAQSAHELAFRERALNQHAIVAITDRSGRIIHVNDLFCEISGYSADELLGQDHRLINSGFHPKSFFTDMYRTIARGEVWHGEIRNRRKNGDIYWVKTTIVPDVDDAGNVTRYIAVRDDITPLKLAEERLRGTIRNLEFQRENLDRKNEELEQFAYVASHDLQEPLRMVSSYLQLLERRYTDKLDDDAKEFIAFAVDGAKRMKQLINDLLLFSRIERKGEALLPIESGPVLQEVLADLGASIAESGAEVTASDLPAVKADRTQLRQLFQNLIGNAIKFRRPGTPRIDISVVRDADHWVFSVADNGIGIDSQYNERIFEVFQRLHAGHQYPGTGIGLAVCRKIVERHGGTIWVEPNPDGGSIFKFTLPVREDAHDYQSLAA